MAEEKDRQDDNLKEGIETLIEDANKVFKVAVVRGAEAAESVGAARR